MGGDRAEAWSAREEFKGPLFCRNTGRARGGAEQPDMDVSSAMEKVRAWPSGQEMLAQLRASGQTSRFEASAF